MVVHRGGLGVLVGESGCGKSTLACAVMGYLPDTAEVGGSLRFEGSDISEMSGVELRALRGNRIAMVYQDPATSLTPTMRVGTQSQEVWREHLGMDAEQARERREEGGEAANDSRASELWPRCWWAGGAGARKPPIPRSFRRRRRTCRLRPTSRRPSPRRWSWARCPILSLIPRQLWTPETSHRAWQPSSHRRRWHWTRQPLPPQRRDLRSRRNRPLRQRPPQFPHQHRSLPRRRSRLPPRPCPSPRQRRPPSPLPHPSQPRRLPPRPPPIQLRCPSR